MSTEVMKQSLAALVAMRNEAAARDCGLRICDEAIAALRQAIAQPAQRQPNDAGIAGECQEATDLQGDSTQPAHVPAADHFAPPFSNCSFRLCDLPRQCRGEGKCHHPLPTAPEVK